MPKIPFLITVDTEGDNLWSKPQDITTHNAAFLPRFQWLCERYRFKPVYLVNYEMAMSEVFVEFGRDVLARGTGEIGMHLHAWNSPPLEPLTGDDFRHQPYLIEYADRVMKEKIHVMTCLLEDRFDRKMLSHRAGRWAFDRRYAKMLFDEGYRIDCSVTPGVNWSANPGDPRGKGGADYTRFPDRPYFFNPSDIAVPADGPMLEVPMTVAPSRLMRRAPWIYKVPGIRRVARRISPAQRWLCPVPLLERYNGEAMLDAACRARLDNPTHLEFMLHSSDVVPGGSPSFKTPADIDHLYACLEALFEQISDWGRGTTLEEFRARCIASPQESGVLGRSEDPADTLISPLYTPSYAGMAHQRDQKAHSE